MKADLSDDINKLIEKKRQDLLRVTNSGLVTLFWETGEELNKYTGKSRIHLIQAVSAQLVVNHGSWFDQKNLKRMAKFAVQFPDLSKVTQIAPFISWEHIKVLLKVRDMDTKLSYIGLVIEEGLSAGDLRKRVSAQFLKGRTARDGVRSLNTAGVKENTRMFSQLFQLGMKQTAINKLVAGNFFKEPLLSSFRPLMESSKKNAGGDRIKAITDEAKLLRTLAQRIKKYKYRQNRWVNSFINLTLLEIGKLINERIPKESSDINQEKTIRNIAVQLATKYKKPFSEKQLYELSDYAEQFADPNIAVRIACMISWGHILAVLPLSEMEAKLFYARLAATRGLSAVGLRRKIAAKIYEQTSGAREIEQKTIASLRNSSLKEEKFKKNIPGKVFIDFSDMRDEWEVPGVFDNPYLTLLLQTSI